MAESAVRSLLSALRHATDLERTRSRHCSPFTAAWLIMTDVVPLTLLAKLLVCCIVLKPLYEGNVATGCAGQ
jgi:hypothetical protein